VSTIVHAMLLTNYDYKIRPKAMLRTRTLLLYDTHSTDGLVCPPTNVTIIYRLVSHQR